MSDANLAQRNGQGRTTALVVGVCLALLALSGCQSPEPETTSTSQADAPPPAREDYPALQGQLFELATDQGTNAASGSRANLTVENNQVRVVLEASEAQSTDVLRWAVEALHGRVETTHENLVQAWVPVDALLTLAEHPRVAFIRAPVRPRR